VHNEAHEVLWRQRSCAQWSDSVVYTVVCPFHLNGFDVPTLLRLPKHDERSFWYTFWNEYISREKGSFCKLGGWICIPGIPSDWWFCRKVHVWQGTDTRLFRYVLKLPFEEQTFLGSKTPVSNHCKNFPFLQSLANGHCEITGIQSDFLYLESEPVDLSIQPFKIWHRIMNVS